MKRDFRLNDRNSASLYARGKLSPDLSQGQLNESEGLRAQFKLGTETGGAFTIPFAHSSFLARYRWRPRVSFESTERCQDKSKAIETDKYERKTGPRVQDLG